MSRREGVVSMHEVPEEEWQEGRFAGGEQCFGLLGLSHPQARGDLPQQAVLCVELEVEARRFFCEQLPEVSASAASRSFPRANREYE